MDQQNPATPSTAQTPVTVAVSQPVDPPPAQPPPSLPQISAALQQHQNPPPQQQHQHPPQQLQQQHQLLIAQPSPSAALTPIPNPNPNTSSKPSIPVVQPQSQPAPGGAATPRPHRQWQHPHPHTHFQHFSSPSPPTSVASISSATSAPISTQQQRGGIAIGVPATHPTPYGQQFGGLNRGPVNVPDSATSSTASQVRHGMQGIGMMSSMGASSQMRPGGIPAHQQQRPVQSSIRPSTTPSTQSQNTQNFQGHSFMRPSGGLAGASATNTSQSLQLPNQPWLASGSQGKPPIPPASHRPQMSPQTLQQRAPVPQQHHSVPATSHQQHSPSSAQPQQAGEQTARTLASVSVPHPQPNPRAIASANQKQPSQAMPQPSALQTVNKAANTEIDETSTRILSKRSIQDLLGQIDPSEKLDPEVEDILADIADEFVESITTFGCSLAKHRKSDTLEAKDILLHLEKNWNITLPGFSGDEIKTYQKPLTNDIHKERLAVIKKSVLASETAAARNVGQGGGGSAKSNLTKTPANPLVSPPNLTKTT
ncbi:unnamed protein product [Linum tenue]|uniref:Transcription initiation factor TFIID subunit 12 domain-containing protein n=1 Tax=Linum tenue TaxID=586396 RepID=A0AAV0JEB0_9ROSI|nr:unnamed protein product [Linum tenue]